MRKPAASSPSDELAHGQIVIVTARWILVLAGLVFILWHPDSVGVLRAQLVGIFALAGVNFYLHTRLLGRRPLLPPIVYAASVMDSAVVTLVIFAQGGFTSNAYIFYFPALLAFSVAFSGLVTSAFTAGTMALYALACLPLEGDVQILAARLSMLAAVATCGNTYWRIERDRRANLPGHHPSPLARGAVEETP